MEEQQPRKKARTSSITSILNPSHTISFDLRLFTFAQFQYLSERVQRAIKSYINSRKSHEAEKQDNNAAQSSEWIDIGTWGENEWENDVLKLDLWS